VLSEGGINYKTIPATYKTVTDKELIEPEQTIVNIIPAKYETRTRKIMVKEESGKWVKKKKDPNCFSENPEDCLIACYEKIPAVYKTETYDVMVSAADTVERIIPAKYKTITKQVVDTPEKVKEIPYDPIYKTVREQVMVTPEKIKEEPVPAVYKQVMGKLQRALRAEGYSIGVVDGVLGARTQTSLKQFQIDNNLPVGNLNMETLKSLGIPH